MTRREWARQLSALGRHAMRQARQERIARYQAIGGDRMSAARAARRLGVSRRTIWRYRRELAQRAVTPDA